MKVLVTGATGYLGRRLVARLLSQGDEVRALVRKSSNTAHLTGLNIDIVCGDLKDRKSLTPAVEGAEIVYHAGAATGGSWTDYEEASIKGTENMLEVSLQARVQRFVHISSIVVYGVYRLPKNALVDENCPCETRPEDVGPYTYSKVEAEKLVSRCNQKGLPTVILRPGLIYGAPGRGLPPNIGFLLRDWLFVMVGAGRGLLPLTHVENTVDGILLASRNEQAIGRAYNIVDDGQITQREYLRVFRAATHARFFTIYLPSPALLLLGTAADAARNIGFLKTAGPSKYGLVSKWKSLRFDASKAKRELKWRPRITLAEGLKTVTW